MGESIFDQPHVETAREFYKRFFSCERQLRSKIKSAEAFRQLCRELPDDFIDEGVYQKLCDLETGVDGAAAIFSGFILANRDHIRFV